MSTSRLMNHNYGGQLFCSTFNSGCGRIAGDNSGSYAVGLNCVQPASSTSDYLIVTSMHSAMQKTGEADQSHQLVQHNYSMAENSHAKDLAEVLKGLLEMQSTCGAADNQCKSSTSTAELNDHFQLWLDHQGGLDQVPGLINGKIRAENPAESDDELRGVVNTSCYGTEKRNELQLLAAQDSVEYASDTILAEIYCKGSGGVVDWSHHPGGSPSSISDEGATLECIIRNNQQPDLPQLDENLVAASNGSSSSVPITVRSASCVLLGEYDDIIDSLSAQKSASLEGGSASSDQSAATCTQLTANSSDTSYNLLDCSSTEFNFYTNMEVEPVLPDKTMPPNVSCESDHDDLSSILDLRQCTASMHMHMNCGDTISSFTDRCMDSENMVTAGIRPSIIGGVNRGRSKGDPSSSVTRAKTWCFDTEGESSSLRRGFCSTRRCTGINDKKKRKAVEPAGRAAGSELESEGGAAQLRLVDNMGELPARRDQEDMNGLQLEQAQQLPRKMIGAEVVEHADYGHEFEARNYMKERVAVMTQELIDDEEFVVNHMAEAATSGMDEQQLQKTAARHQDLMKQYIASLDGQSITHNNNINQCTTSAVGTDEMEAAGRGAAARSCNSADRGGELEAAPGGSRVHVLDRSCKMPNIVMHDQYASMLMQGGQSTRAAAASTREMMYRAAAYGPMDWGSIKRDAGRAARPRRNVRISKDPQSVAARRRRERISERMRILQRLVPGGTKMDTASMLDEAVLYLKFLQSQLAAHAALEAAASSSSSATSISAAAAAAAASACASASLAAPAAACTSS